MLFLKGTLLEGLDRHEVEALRETAKRLTDVATDGVQAHALSGRRGRLVALRAELLSLAAILATNEAVVGGGIEAAVEDACARLRQAALHMTADHQAAGRA